MDNLEESTRLSVSEQFELADATFSDPESTLKEYGANILRLAQNVENSEIRELGNKLAELAVTHRPDDLKSTLDYCSARRICAEELYLHFYGTGC
ncbi:MAG: hypothetical protein F4X83_00110 [Chloroflexi bacterium]|nr:hypothetical protein [Chloroflexota bacterium]